MAIPFIVWPILAAVIGLAAGFAAGSTSADNSEEAKKSEEKAGEATVQAQQARDKVKQAAAKFKEYGLFEDFVVTLVAVGFGVACADAEVVESEEQAIEEFLLGVTRSALPDQIKEQIKQLRECPPTFNQTLEYLKRIQDHPAFDPDIIDDIIEITMKADGKIRPGERAFRKAWQDYRRESA